MRKRKPSGVIIICVEAFSRSMPSRFIYAINSSSTSRPEYSAGISYASHCPIVRSASGFPLWCIRHASTGNDSSVRTEVVPTAVTSHSCASRRSSSESVTSKCSVCIGCSAALSLLTGRNVPAPTCSVTSPNSNPVARICSIITSVKCRPAVGAATDPSNLEYTVW